MNVEWSISRDALECSTNDVINSMKDLGRSMFFEINALTNMQNDIDAGPSASNGTPGQISGPPRKQYSI